MIITLTPNPALDVSGTVSNLVPNEKSYVSHELRLPGAMGSMPRELLTVWEPLFSPLVFWVEVPAQNFWNYWIMRRFFTILSRSGARPEPMSPFPWKQVMNKPDLVFPGQKFKRKKVALY